MGCSQMKSHHPQDGPHLAAATGAFPPSAVGFPVTSPSFVGSACSSVVPMKTDFGFRDPSSTAGYNSWVEMCSQLGQITFEAEVSQREK